MNKVVLFSFFAFILFSASFQAVNAQKVTKKANIYEIPRPIDLKAADFKKMTTEKDVVILDIRTVREFNAGHIKGAVNVDWYRRTFEVGVSKLPKDKKIIIYCRSGNRTSKAKYFLIGMGFKKVYNLYNGLNDWAMNKYMLVK